MTRKLLYVTRKVEERQKSLEEKMTMKSEEGQEKMDKNIKEMKVRMDYNIINMNKRMTKIMEGFMEKRHYKSYIIC